MDLGSVLVEDHTVEVAALVVVDQIISGVAGLHATLADILVLLQRLVESKDDLTIGETIEWETLLLHPLHCSDLLVLLLSELCQVQIKNWEASETSDNVEHESFLTSITHLDAMSLLVRPLTISMAHTGLFLSQFPVIAL